MLDVPFRPDRRSPAPLRQQLADHLRSLVTGGRLAPGEKLPATRDLARSLGVGRNTVLQAYEALIDEGVLIAHVGQGTFVATTASALRLAPAGESTGERPFAWDALFSRQARLALPAWLRSQPRPEAIAFDFRGGRVDSDALPIRALRSAWSHALGHVLPERANDTDPLGDPRLRRAIARALGGRGIHCGPDEILVTAGAQQALDLTARVLIDPGDAVAVEQPGYFGAAMTFTTAGAELVGIDVDDEGLRTDALARALRARRLKAVYVTPAAQMPTGATLSDARRRALLELADQTQTPVIEDDYDSEFRFDNPALPALKTEDRAGQVVYVGTFSKALFPGLRLGYVVAAPALLRRLAVARLTASLAADLTTQAAVAELMASGAFERHVRRLRKRYAVRREALLAALAASMPDGTTWTTPRAGLAVWVTLPPDVDGERLHEAALDRGIVTVPGQSCYADGRGGGQLALAFSNQTPERIAEGIAALSDVARRVRRGRRSA